MWIKYQTLDSMEQFFQWDERQLAAGKLSTAYLEVPWDKTTLEYFQTTPKESTVGIEIDPPHSYGGTNCLWNAFSVLLPENFHKITWKEFMDLRLSNSTLSHGTMSPAGYRGPPKTDSNPNPQHLLNFEKSIKREVYQYTALKDEKNFEAFKRILLVTATTHFVVKMVWKHTTCLDMMQIAKNCSNRNNTSCTVFSTRSFIVIWVKP